MKITVYTDGSCEPNPGPAGYGWAAYESDSLIQEGFGHIGYGTNNEAEYAGVLAALVALRPLHPDSVLVRSDSKLIVEQLRGRWKAHKPHLALLRDQVLAVSQGFRRVRYEWVPRERNTVADALSKKGQRGGRASQHFTPRGLGLAGPGAATG